MRIAELRATVQRRTPNLYDTLFTRRVSIYLTAALAPLGVTANQVSAFGTLVGLSACALIAFGSPALVLAGVALVHCYAVLDSVDGELARLGKTFSLKGLFLEDYSAYTMINAFNLAIGWYLHRTGHGDVPLIVAVALAAFGRNAMPVARRALIKSIATRRPLAPAPAAAAPAAAPSGLRAFVQEHILHVTNIWVVVTTLVVVETLAGLARLGLVEIALYFFMAALFAKELLIVARYAGGGALDDELRQLYAAAAQAREHGAAVSGVELAGYSP